MIKCKLLVYPKFFQVQIIDIAKVTKAIFLRVLFSLIMYFKRPNVKLAEAMSASIDCIER